MLKVTTWSPDTCGCVIRLEWDDAVPASERTHTPRTVTACDTHAAAPGARAVDRAADVLAENQGKNRAIAALVEFAPDIAAETVAWAFDADRRVQLTAPSQLGARKAAAQAALDARFGRGVVTLA